MKIKTAIYGDISKILESQFIAKRRVVTTQIRNAGEDLKNVLRGQVVRAGLGQKVANAWRSRNYGKEASYNPAALVWSKAPKIHAAFDESSVIKARNGSKYLAIPTPHVPRRGGAGGRKYLTPVEVEADLNIELEFVAYSNGRPGGMLVAPALVQAKNKRGWRRATAKRLKAGRKAQPVIMFYLVPSARLKKALDIGGAVKDALNKLSNNLQQRFGK